MKETIWSKTTVIVELQHSNTHNKIRWSNDEYWVHLKHPVAQNKLIINLNRNNSLSSLGKVILWRGYILTLYLDQRTRIKNCYILKFERSLFLQFSLYSPHRVRTAHLMELKYLHMSVIPQLIERNKYHSLKVLVNYSYDFDPFLWPSTHKRKIYANV